jgi:hypothetical protein
VLQATSLTIIVLSIIQTQNHTKTNQGSQVSNHLNLFSFEKRQKINDTFWFSNSSLRKVMIPVLMERFGVIIDLFAYCFVCRIYQKKGTIISKQVEAFFDVLCVCVEKL